MIAIEDGPPVDTARRPCRPAPRPAAKPRRARHIARRIVRFEDQAFPRWTRGFRSLAAAGARSMPIEGPLTHLTPARMSTRIGSGAPLALFRGTPFGWQSTHVTRWTSWRLSGERNVVSIVSTSSPQFDSRGWQPAQEARVVWPCFAWQARQLRPSWTPTGVRSSPEKTCMLGARRVALVAERLPAVGAHLHRPVAVPHRGQGQAGPRPRARAPRRS